MMAISQLEFSSFTRGLSLNRLTKKIYLPFKKTFDPEKSGYAKKYALQKFLGGGGGKGDLEKSRFYWVFLNDGVP